MRLRLAILFGVALAACSSQKDETKPEAVVRPKHDRPFNSHFDALEKLYLPRGEFPPGVLVVSAPIHSTATTTLFFVALRGAIAPYVNPAREETFFIVKGSGTLELAGKSKPVEGGYVVRVPPGFSHGLTAQPADPLEAIVVVTPSVVANQDEPKEKWAKASTQDDRDAIGSVYCQDVTLPNLIKTPSDPDPKHPAHFKTATFLDQSKHSTLQLAAVQLDRIPEHRHLDHDETVILFFQEGFGFLRLDGVIDPVEAVQVSCVPAGTLHSYEHKANGQARAISVFTPGYDGHDVALVEEKNDVQPPPGWQKTREDQFLEPGQHARQGDSVPSKNAQNDPINIGNPPSGR